MAENENVQNPEAQQPQAQPEQDDQPVFQLQRCYLKDASAARTGYSADSSGIGSAGRYPVRSEPAPRSG